MSRVRERFVELSPSEFFYRNREIAGFTNPSRALFSALRELIENSMDACELHRIPPDIYANIALEEKIAANTGIYKLRVQDNGSGIPQKEILNAFGRVFYSTKYVLRQSRGTFGLGGTLALLYGQITTHKPIHVVSSTGGKKIHSYVFLIDIERNRPQIVENRNMENKRGWHGTIVEFSLVGNYPRISNKITSYLKHTAVVAPYAEIKFVDPLGRLYFFRRTIKDVPKPPKETKPHPHGVDVERLKKMVKQGGPQKTLMEFMCLDFHRVGERTAEKFLSYAGLKPDRKLFKLTVEEIAQLSRALGTYEDFLPPRPDMLSPIGEDFFREGIRKEYELGPTDFLEVVTRPSASYSGHPFIIEAALAYGGNIRGSSGEIILHRYANKIPLLFDEGSDVSLKIINDINWNYYKKPTDGPLAFFIHICSTKIPFRSLGKEFIADIPEVEREIRAAVRFLLRRLSTYAGRAERRKRITKRIGIYYKYLPKIAEFSSKLAETDSVPSIERLIERVKKKFEGVKD